VAIVECARSAADKRWRLSRVLDKAVKI